MANVNVAADGRTHPERYGELLDALVAVEPSPITGEIDPCSVKFVLGEVGDVWPESVREDMAREKSRDAA